MLLRRTAFTCLTPFCYYLNFTRIEHFSIRFISSSSTKRSSFKEPLSQQGSRIAVSDTCGAHVGLQAESEMKSNSSSVFFEECVPGHWRTCGYRQVVRDHLRRKLRSSSLKPICLSDSAHSEKLTFTILFQAAKVWAAILSCNSTCWRPYSLSPNRSGHIHCNGMGVGAGHTDHIKTKQWWATQQLSVHRSRFTQM